MVARMVRDHEAASSSLATPTKIKLGLLLRTEFYFVKKYESRRALPPWAFPLLYRIKKAPTIVGAFCWSGRRGSNSLPPPWQGGALPDELRPRGANKSYYNALFAFVKLFFAQTRSISILRRNPPSRPGAPTCRVYVPPCSTSIVPRRRCPAQTEAFRNSR